MFTVTHNINDYDFSAGGGPVDYFRGVFDDQSIAIKAVTKEINTKLKEMNEDGEELHTLVLDKIGTTISLTISSEEEWVERYYISEATLNKLVD